MDFVSKRHLIHDVSKSSVSQAISPMKSHDPHTVLYPSTVTNFPIIAIIIVGMSTTSLLLMCYYIIVIKFCLNWNHADLVRVRGLSLSGRQHEEEPSENRGLEEAVIQSIPVIHYRTEISDDYSSERRSFYECAVCLNEFQQDEELRVIPNCSHVFHIDCVDVWLQNNANCPLCRSHISLTSQSQTEAHQLPITPRPSPQDRSQNVENLIGVGDEDFVVIDLNDDKHDGSQNMQERGKELEVPTRKHHKVISMGDECVVIGNKDDGFFSVQQHIRRSFSMDL